MTRDQIWAAILAERARQTAKWEGEHDWGHGDCSSDGVSAAVKAAVLAEECGEVAREALDGTLGLKDELIQVAAVAVAWLEAL
jgi:NTP pyrophosphatase (non-canonical NTP hydrolase)